MAELESHAASLRRAADRGNAEENTPQQDPSSGGQLEDEQHSANRGRDSDDELDEPLEDSGSKSHSSKKQLVFEHELPWYADDLIAQAILRPKLLQTQKTIAYFSRDFSAIKRFIASSLTIPEFPDSEWDNIIKGRPINLDLHQRCLSRL
jgi:hypothetical protein